MARLSIDLPVTLFGVTDGNVTRIEDERCLQLWRDLNEVACKLR
jgi:hypothetical protein